MKSRTKRDIINKRCAWLFILLVAAQTVLILLSWLLNAVMPDLPVRSLLSAEGIRWLFGSFADNMQTPLLVWLLFASMAYGALRTAARGFKSSSNRFGNHLLVLVEILLFVVVVLILTSIPHAVLLSVTGSLFPSSFSRSIVPLVCTATIVCSLTYAIQQGVVRSLSDFYDLLICGLRYFAQLLPIYIICVQLYYSLRFVFFHISFIPV